MTNASCLDRDTRAWLPFDIAPLTTPGREGPALGDRYAGALEASNAWAARTGALIVHAFDHPCRRG
jgi:hypothetical protein